MMKGVSVYAVCVVVLLLGLFDQGIDGRPAVLRQLPRPSPNDAALFARWLVSQSDWGVLSTIAYDKGGAPFGNVVSFSDGLPDSGLGVPYFFKSALDPTARYASEDPRASLALGEIPIGTCAGKDPEDPICARITLTGKLMLLEANSKELEFAQNALFTKHPVMKEWAKYAGSHNFQYFKLEIEDIFLINRYGNARYVTVDQYLQSNLTGAHPQSI